MIEIKESKQEQKIVGYRFDEANHYHSLDGKPLIGVSTAISILSKELTWWASGMACGELGWLNSKITAQEARLVSATKKLEQIKAMTPTEYLLLLDSAYKAHSVRKKKAADSGTDMHSLLENYIVSCMTNGSKATDKRIEPFARWAEANVERFLFSEMHCYSEVLHAGGIADFGYIDKKGKKVLGDFKSAAAAYWNMWCQVGGYHTLIEENGGYTRTGDKVMEPTGFHYHAIFAERAGLDKPFFNHETQRARRAFGHCVELYKEKLFFGGENA